MNKLIVVALLVDQFVFCQVRRPDYETFPTKTAWCSVTDRHSDRVYYSDIFQYDNVSPAPPYADEFKAYVLGLKDGPNPNWTTSQCYGWVGNVANAVSRNRDNDIRLNESRKKNIILTRWVVTLLENPELQYAWCSAMPVVADERAYQHPYSEIFLYDPAYENGSRTYANDFIDYLTKKNHIDYIPHCTIAHRGGEPAAKATLNQWLRQEHGKDQPISTHWKPQSVK